MQTLRRWRIFLKALTFFVFVFTPLMSLTVFVEAQTGISLPANFTSNLVAGGMRLPTTMQFAPDGRLFVLQQEGAVRIIKNGTLLNTSFLILSNVDSSSERGLLGIAFDPNFASNNFLYLYYTTNTPAPTHNRISRFTANCPTNCDVVAPGSELVLMDLDTPSFDNAWHNGGTMSFGMDGKLYIGTGETHRSANAQELTNRLGKILRINSNGTIPSDNPFFSTATGNNRAIWAMGLRNPYVFAFQPGTGRMFINDVGQDTYEEINDGIAGRNYGWPCREGNVNGPNTSLCDGSVTLTGPLYTYAHTSGTVTGCAITGGVFYNPATAQFPASYVGKYFFADYCGSWIKLFNVNPATVSNFASNTATSIVDLKVSSNGELYYLSGGSSTNGQVYRISYSGGGTAPSITQHPANTTVAVGNTAQFTCAASGTTPLSYQWQKNNQNIPGATSSSYTTPATTIGDNGALFRCRVTNSIGTATSNNATLTVLPEQPPTATIITPAAGTRYSGGETINFSGTGVDLEDGTLPPSAFSWDVKLHHNSTGGPHVHNISSFTGAIGGSFAVSTTLHGDASENIFYRITLTVTDSDGMTDTASIDLDPRVVTINIRSVPSGLRIIIDGVEITTPRTAQWVVGVSRELDAVSPQVKSSKIYDFSSWSDAGAAIHSITTPSTNTTYTATYVEGVPIPNQFAVTTPTLTWSSIPWALAYQVQVDDDLNFGSPEFDDNDIPPGTLSVSPTLMDGKQYWWRVRARRDDQTWGPWSGINTFTIDVP